MNAYSLMTKLLRPTNEGSAAFEVRQPILLPRTGDTIPAYVADPESGVVTIVLLGRGDDHPATIRYGGGVQLLESILTTFDVWPAEPGQVPTNP